MERNQPASGPENTPKSYDDNIRYKGIKATSSAAYKLAYQSYQLGLFTINEEKITEKPKETREYASQDSNVSSSTL
jgi:hypothetical protein